jgi:thioredoxin 1
MKTCLRVLFAVIFVLTMSIGSAAAESVEIPVKDMVTLIDFGAHSCIPCKMMAPILDKLQQDYKGKAAVIFI